jgi:hypothetical protein
MLLQGCAGLIQGKQDMTAPAEVPAGEGRVLVHKGRPGIVIGAPRAVLDRNTDVIAGDLARLTGFGLVVVKVPGGRESDTDGVVGTPARFDPETPGARRMYDAYRRYVTEASQGPLVLYVEIDGSGRSGSAGRVEIAAVGLGRDDGWRLQTLFELIRDSRLDDPAVPRLEVWVESVDPARAGVLNVAPRALHIDLPGAARTTYREIYTKVLGEFLSESVAVLMPRPR